MATIVIADDHELVRAGLRRILHAHGHSVVAESGDGRHVVQVVEETRPAVLLLDLGLPGVHGLDVLRVVTRRVPATKVLIVSAFGREEFVLAALRHGAAGYVLKGSNVDDLLTAIDEVLRGGCHVSPSLAGSFAKACTLDEPGVAPDPFETLSPRELQVFHLITQGLLNHEVGPRLSISARTVETHRKSVMGKLGLRTQTDVILYALRRGLLAVDEVGGAARQDV